MAKKLSAAAQAELDDSLKMRIRFYGELDQAETLPWARHLKPEERNNVMNPEKIHSLVDMMELLHNRLCIAWPQVAGELITYPNQIHWVGSEKHSFIVEGGKRLNIIMPPFEESEYNTALFPLLFMLLCNDWVGEPVRVMCSNVPDWLAMRAIGLYLDLMGMQSTHETKEFSGARTVSLIPRLHEDLVHKRLEPFKLYYNLDPSWHAKGSKSYREYMCLCFGLVVAEQPDPPLTFQPHFLNLLVKATSPTLSYSNPMSEPLDDSTPVAAAADALYHKQYERVLERISTQRVVFLVKSNHGIGASHMIMQAAQQLVAGAQVMFTEGISGYHGQLHPSLEFAYRNGGIVVVTNELSASLIGPLLAGQPLIGLQHPNRPPEASDDFHVVVELDHAQFEYMMNKTQNASLGGLAEFIEEDLELVELLFAKPFASKIVIEKYQLLRECLPFTQRNSLHLATQLAKAPYPARFIERVIRSNSGITKGDAARKLIEELVAIESGAKPTRSKPSKAEKAKADETASPEQQQEALRQLVASVPPEVVSPPPVPASEVLTVSTDAPPPPEEGEQTAGDDTDYGF